MFSVVTIVALALVCQSDAVGNTGSWPPPSHGQYDYKGVVERVMNQAVDDMEPAKFKYLRRDKNMGADEEQYAKSRHEAEAEFFNLDKNVVKDCLTDIVSQRFRDPYNKTPRKGSEILKGKSARLKIAAEMAFQKKLLLLSNYRAGAKSSPSYGLPLDSVRKFGKNYISFGPPEKYIVNGVVITCRHRTDGPEVQSEESCEDNDDAEDPSQESCEVSQPAKKRKQSARRPAPPNQHTEKLKMARLGKIFVDEVATYEEINNTLKRILTRLDNDKEKSLAGIFLDFSKHHQINEKYFKKLTLTEMEDLIRICFLMMEGEQAQWMASHYVEGDGKIGMTVSFARLILLWHGGHIKLKDVMGENYAIYTIKNMVLHMCHIKKSCYNIDVKYKEAFRKSKLDKAQALSDLKAVYGDV